MPSGTTTFFHRKRGFGVIKRDDSRAEVFVLHVLLPALLAALLLLFVMARVHFTALAWEHPTNAGPTMRDAEGSS